MASIDSSWVEEDLKKLIRTSSRLKDILKGVFLQLEEDPSVYEELTEVDPSLIKEFPHVTFRKIKLIHQRHDFRIIIAHYLLDESQEHVDVLMVFPRKSGYLIDWDWVESAVKGR